MKRLLLACAFTLILLPAPAPASAQVQVRTLALALALARSTPTGPYSITPHPVTFPTDAAMHPAAPVEWWYYVGHLADAHGHSYGVEVTFFKFSGLRRYIPASSVDTVYRTDVAITDEAVRRFYHGITYVPMAPNLTTASTHELRLRAGDIDITTLGALRYGLHGALPRGNGNVNGSIDLSVASLRTPMLVDGGFLGWGSGYTYYYSLTHMSAAGTLTIAGRRIPVHGVAWADHQWGDMGGSSVRGWDWMALQLDDHTDVNMVNERPAIFSRSRWAMALLPDNRQIFMHDAIITPLGHWRSPHTGTVYPSGWRVRVPHLRLDVVVRPTMLDQEMVDSYIVHGYKDSYWEGSCTVSGTRDGRPVHGKAYTELTGYGTPPHVQYLQ